MTKSGNNDFFSRIRGAAKGLAPQYSDMRCELREWGGKYIGSSLVTDGVLLNEQLAESTTAKPGDLKAIFYDSHTSYRSLITITNG